MPRLLDLFCGRGTWTIAFLKRGWKATGVDIINHGYPAPLIIADATTLDIQWILSFDAVVASPPCDDFARAWLPWLRDDHTPEPHSMKLLDFAIRVARTHPIAITECSLFAARHRKPDATVGPYALWGAIPALLPYTTKAKARLSGTDPLRRAAIDSSLADWIADQFTKTLRSQRPISDQTRGRKRQ